MAYPQQPMSEEDRAHQAYLDSIAREKTDQSNDAKSFNGYEDDQQKQGMVNQLSRGRDGSDQMHPHVTGFNFQDTGMSDPIAQIAMRLGQIRGESLNQRGGNYIGNSATNSADIQAGPLQDLLEQYMNERRAKIAAARPSTSRPSLMAGAQGGDHPSSYYAQQQQQAMLRQSQHPDETKQRNHVRDEAINAALRYMHINNPHLISSLNLYPTGKR